jgi:iron(III) transport system permease protein
VPGAALVLGLVLYPYVYMLARAAFLAQSVCLLEISRTLGAGPWRTFARVGLPMARPAIVTGVVLALMETIGDYGVVQHFSVSTFSTGIFRTWYGLGNLTAATQLAAALLAVVFLLLALERFGRGGAAYHHTTTRYRPLPAFTLRGAKAWAAVAACVAPLLFGFVLPAGLLATWAVQTAPRVLDDRFWVYASNTVLVAALAALLAVAVALVLAFAARLRPGPVTTWAARVATLGYAVPGAVVAVGVMIPLGWFDNALDSWMRTHVGVSTGLLLSGTLAAMLFCYVVRFLAISFNAVESGMTKITPNMDRAARSLGAGPWAALRRIQVPLLRGSLLTAAVLVFVDTMKELPATLILRPFNFDTLAVRTYELASDERLAEASNYALSIVLFGLLPVILLSSAIARSRPGQH